MSNGNAFEFATRALSEVLKIGGQFRKKNYAIGNIYWLGSMNVAILHIM